MSLESAVFWLARQPPDAMKALSTLRLGVARGAWRLVCTCAAAHRLGLPWEPTIGFSRAVRDDRLIFASATATIWADGHVDLDVDAQARRCLEIIDEALREAGATLRDVVRTRVFLVDASHGTDVTRVHGEVFGEIRPASGFIVVQGFLDPRWLVEIEADAIIGG